MKRNTSHGGSREGGDIFWAGLFGPIPLGGLHITPQHPTWKQVGPGLPGGMSALVVDLKLGHQGDDGLDDQRDDVRPHLLDVNALRGEAVEHAGERALAARALAVRVHKVAALHVQGVVGEVHEHMAHVLLVGLLWGGGGAHRHTRQLLFPWKQLDH